VDLQRMFDDATPAGLQYYVKSDFLTGLNPDALDRLATHGTTPSSPRNQMLLRRLGGRIADIDPAATAFATRDAQHMLLLAGAWTDPTDDPTPHRDWVRGAWEAVRPWARGTYVNHLGDEGTARLREAYPPTTWRRLTALKRRMDPANVFAHNQNIPPQA
jgi:FAD/FMN-containing dehydrogenase